MNIQGKTALVSGANRGIGKAITIELLEAGAKRVYAGARNTNTLTELHNTYGERLVPIELDVTKDDTIQHAAETAKDVDILVNNAGIFAFGNFLGGNLLESFDSNLQVNLYGLVKLTNAFLPTLKEKENAAIVCISTMAALANMPMGLTYSASKAAVHSTIQGLRGELHNTNILVTEVYPGPIDTDMTKDFDDIEKDSPETVAKNVIIGIQEKKEDIFPDKMSQQVGPQYFTSPKTLEKQFSEFR